MEEVEQYQQFIYPGLLFHRFTELYSTQTGTSAQLIHAVQDVYQRKSHLRLPLSLLRAKKICPSLSNLSL